MGLLDYRDLSTGEIETLAALANAAYADEPAPDGWRTLGADDLGFEGGPIDGSFEDGYYIGGAFTLFSAAARILQDEDTLTVAFRGTDTVKNFALYPELLNVDLFVDNFAPLLDVVADYVNDPANRIENVWVTGHSLGAAAVNELEDQKFTAYDGAFGNGYYVAFASPQLYRPEGNPGLLPDVLNVGFEDDWVFKAVERTTPLSAAQPDFLTATNNLVWYDDTYANPDFAFPLFNPVSDTTAHSLVNYIEAVSRAAASTFYNGTDSDTVVIFVDTDARVTDKRAPTSDHFGAPALYLGRPVADDIAGGQAADSLEGFAGDDTLEGAGGDDRIDGGPGSDTAVYRSAFADYRVERGPDGTITVEQLAGTPSDGTDTLLDVEFARFTDRTIELGVGLGASDAFPVLGSAADDVLAGDAARDVMRGLAGDDRLAGRAGADLIEGGGGRDTLLGGAGDDVIEGNGAGDRLRGGAGEDVLLAGAGADRAFGGAGRDVIEGGAGRDRLAGGGESDALFGGHGADLLRGGAGVDRLSGGAGDDTLKGGAGADVLAGEAGRNVLFGDAGADRFVLSADGRAVIGDFEGGRDTLDLAAFEIVDGDSFDERVALDAARSDTFVIIDGDVVARVRDTVLDGDDFVM